MKLYLYPGSTVQECQFCKREQLPLTFFHGRPVCQKCSQMKGFEPVEIELPTESTKGKTPVPILTPQDEAAILEMLSSGPATTAEIGLTLGDKPNTAHAAGDRNKTLKKLVHLQQKGKVFRFGGRAGRASWWAISLDARVPNMDGKVFREQIIEILRYCDRPLSLQELKLKLGKNPDDIRNVGGRMVEQGEIRRFHEGDEEFYELI